ncbi:MAG: aldolase/citrate lyase family protein [Dehalococcoidales bacterium]|nr:aldolase/citrate lyase family protein [Dehalococcoidales bacterium]
MKTNILRKLLNEGKPTLGTHVISPWPRIVEVIGHTGAFDYIEYVAEYSTYDIEQLENFGRAIDLFPNMSSMIKIEEQLKGFLTTRAVDSGIESVLFTDCRSAEDVRQSIRLIRAETPDEGSGVHGAGSRRIVLGSNPAEWVQKMKDVVVAVMIEKESAMNELEDILSIKGLDMVQFGPNDYSISIGMPGQVRDPKVQAKQMEMIKLALEKGVAPRVEISGYEQAAPYIKEGVRHFCMGTDLGILSAWCIEHSKGIKELLAKA